MKTTKEKYNHQYGFKISLIFSLLIFISLFSFIPIENKNKEMKVENLFDLSDVITIPPTKQVNENIAYPKLPKIFIPVEETEDYILSDEIIAKLNLVKNEKVNLNSNIKFISYQPKQTLEVLPKKVGEDIKGYVKIKIKIGENGIAQDYKILENTTQSKECIEEVVNAVYKSRWEAFNKTTSEKEYWIKKTYWFN
ncbi:MAG: hypothetical protein COW08_03920 [Ignavibacteriales bacterium CG12_big_fil_rev_8_21_14_0_65_30_8]|nr:MAG: hypothetical protein COW08_03920 [Ignavibacteriales bacterium CG12_big_fil_rev_8_21_14_0_65_30_8]